MRRASWIGLGLAVALSLTVPVVAYAGDPPVNDAFENATEIGTFPQTFTDVDITTAGWETDERWPCGSTAGTVWYKFTYGADNTGAVQVDAPGARVTAFYQASGSTLAGLSAGFCKGTSSLLIPFFAGRTDYVQIADDGAPGPITVTFTFVARPPNDDLAQAESVDLDGSTTVDTTAETRTATIERVVGNPSQPQPYEIMRSSCFGTSGGSVSFARSVWYVFTAADAGMITIDPGESSFGDVTLNAYVGSPFDGSRAGCVGWRTPLALAVQPDVAYYVQVTDAGPSPTVRSGGGTLRIRWSFDAPPALNLPADIVVEAGGPAGTVVSYAASAFDTVDGPVDAACSRPSGSTFPIGSTIVWCSAFDSAGNLASGSFRVTVRDTVAPSVVYSAHPDTYTLADAIHVACTASDAVGVTATTCADIDGLGWEFGPGVHEYAATAADAAGNEGSGSTQFLVIATYGSMSDLTRAWVSKEGVARDLVALLESAAAAAARGQLQAEAGKLADYRALLKAQAGKSITDAKATMLAAFSRDL